MTTSGPSKGKRLHYFDALRAFAMLLGIGIHAAISFIGSPWMAMDQQRSEGLRWFNETTHAFRMQLFFLVSGYFTMMLYRRRGLGAMMEQRFQRVVVPMLLALCTIGPLLSIVGTWSADTAPKSVPSAESPPLLTAIRAGNLLEVEQLLELGDSPNQRDAKFGIPPLGWATLLGNADMARLLLDSGANVNGRTRDGHRPIHMAAWLGHVEVARVLVSYNADLEARSNNRETWRDSARSDYPGTLFLGGMLEVPVGSPKSLADRRATCTRYLEEAHANRSVIRGSFGAVNETIAGWKNAYRQFLLSPRWNLRMSQTGPPFNLFLAPFFAHMWFLWFLCWLVLLFAIAVKLGGLLRLPAPPAWLVMSPYRLVWLVPLTLAPVCFMGVFVPVFGPDTSLSVLPFPHLLVYYGLFFAYGAIYQEWDDREGKLGRWWWLWLALALAVLPFAYETPGQVLPSGLMEVLFTWSMIFTLIGLFRALLHREYFVVRYLSDSAYWLYLAHLPLVVYLQAVVRDWPYSAVTKFFGICVVATVLLLISYQLLVRHTYLGVILNGHRERMNEKNPETPPSTPPGVPGPVQ